MWNNGYWQKSFNLRFGVIPAACTKYESGLKCTTFKEHIFRATTTVPRSTLGGLCPRKRDDRPSNALELRILKQSRWVRHIGS